MVVISRKAESVSAETLTGKTFSFIHIRRNLLKNSAIMGACRFITSALSLFTIPVIIYKLGIIGYGTWETLLAASSFSTIFQTAISGTLLWRISTAYGANDEREARRILGIGLTIMLLLFAVISITVWILSGRILSLFNVPAQFSRMAFLLLPLIVSMVTLSGVNEAFASYISGHQKTGLVTIIQTLALITYHVTTIILLLSGGGMWSLLAGSVCSFIITFCGLLVVALRVCSKERLYPAIPSRSDLISMNKYAGYLLIGGISTALRGQTDKLVLASFTSPIVVGYYGIASRLAGLVMEISNFFYVPMIAAAGALYTSGDWGAVRRLYSNMMLMVPFVVGAFVVIVAGLYDRLIVMWVGRDISEVAPFLFLLVWANMFAVIMTGPGTALCKGIGRLGMETVYVSVNLVLNLILTIALVSWLGGIGTVIASSLSWSLTSMLFLILMHRNLNLPLVATKRGAYFIAIIMAVVVVARWGIGYFPSSGSRMDALLFAIPAGISIIILYTILLALFRIINFLTLFDMVRNFRKQVNAALLK